MQVQLWHSEYYDIIKGTGAGFPFALPLQVLWKYQDF